MSSTCLPRPIPLARPLPLRWWSALTDAADAAGRWVAASWRRAGSRANLQWEPGMLASLDEHVLRDIGVPDWAREEATARRDGERWLRTWAGGTDTTRRTGW